jgi:hypothetical protein
MPQHESGSRRRALAGIRIHQLGPPALQRRTTALVLSQLTLKICAIPVPVAVPKPRRALMAFRGRFVTRSGTHMICQHIAHRLSMRPGSASDAAGWLT